MGKKEEFKVFAQNNPILLKHVKDGSMTWQSFYEIYDLYGEDKNAWKDYLVTDTDTVEVVERNNTGFVDWIKNLDLDRVSEGVSSLQRVLGVLGDLSVNNKTTEEYKPRPIYKHFED